MIRKIAITLTIVTAAIIMTGCAAKPKAIISKTPNNQAPQAFIKIFNGNGNTFSGWASRETRAFTNAIETAATLTLKKEYKYFAIVKPDEISNLNGSLINTAEEVIEKCSPSKILQFNFHGLGLHKCGTRNTSARLVIAMYKEQPNDFPTYNAKKVIEYLKSKDLYEGQGVEIVEK